MAELCPTCATLRAELAEHRRVLGEAVAALGDEAAAFDHAEQPVNYGCECEHCLRRIAAVKLARLALAAAARLPKPT